MALARYSVAVRARQKAKSQVFVGDHGDERDERDDSTRPDPSGQRREWQPDITALHCAHYHKLTLLALVLLQVIVNDLPIDLFVESMPASLSILEALYAKVFLSDGLDFSLKLLRPEAVVMQMVRLFAGSDANNSWQLCGPFVTSCKKLLKVRPPGHRFWRLF